MSQNELRNYVQRLLTFLVVLVGSYSCTVESEVYIIENDRFDEVNPSGLLFIDYKDSVKIVRLPSIYLWTGYEDYLYIKRDNRNYIFDEDTIKIERSKNNRLVEEIIIQEKDSNYTLPFRHVGKIDNRIENFDEEFFTGKLLSGLIDSTLFYFDKNNTLHLRKGKIYNRYNWYVTSINNNKYVVLDFLHPEIMDVINSGDGICLYSAFYGKELLVETGNNEFIRSKTDLNSIYGNWRVDSISDDFSSIGQNLQINDSLITIFGDEHPDWDKKFKYRKFEEFGVVIIEEYEKDYLIDDKYIIIDLITDSLLNITTSNDLWTGNTGFNSYNYIRSKK